MTKNLWIASTGAQISICVFDFIDLGFQVAYLINGRNYAKGDTPISTGFFFTFMAIGMGVSRIFAGKLVDKGYITQCIHYGYYPVILAFLGLGTCRFIAETSIAFATSIFFIVPVLLAVPALIVAAPYRLQRLSAFLDPWSSPLGEGYQLIQSYYALGSGGLFGVGLFNSRQKYLFLPFAESDFIFSVIGEELGFVGCAAVLAVFGVIVWRGALIAMRAESRFDCYLAAGITAVIGIQALLNVAVVTGSIPPTGLPLPFVSSGGTSLLMFTCATAVLQRVAAKSQRQAFGHKMY